VRIVSGGTDTHLVLADVSAKGLSGRKAERALDAAGITVNKNTIPFDTKSPTVASGIRFGTPALTTRGFGPDEIRQTARWIVQVLDNVDSEEVSDSVRREVETLAQHYPVPGISSVAA
jgi:glycine hydroxymethyltransferase